MADFSLRFKEETMNKRTLHEAVDLEMFSGGPPHVDTVISGPAFS
jgi:hypothetical protein